MHLRRITRFASSLIAATILCTLSHACPIEHPEYQVETFAQWVKLHRHACLEGLHDSDEWAIPLASELAHIELDNSELITKLPRDESRSGPYAAEWRRRIYRGDFSDEDLERAITRCTTVFIAPQCVTGQVLYGSFVKPCWLPWHSVSMGIVQITADGQSLGSDALMFPFKDNWEMFDRHKQPMGVLPAGTTAITVRLFVSTSKIPLDAGVWPKHFDWFHDFTVPIQMLDSAKPRGVNSPEITDQVKKHFPLRASVSRFWRDMQPPTLLIWFDGDRPKDGIAQTGELARTMVCAQVEVLRDGEVIEVAVAHDQTEPDSWLAWDGVLEGEVAQAALDPEQWGRYTLRLTGIHPGFLSSWHRTQYWTGTYTVPFTELMERSTATSEE